MNLVRQGRVSLITGLTALWATTALGQPQSEDQQKCIAALHRDGTKLAATQDKESYRCLRDGGKGQLMGQTVAQCLMADNRGKIARKEKKTRNDFVRKCGVTLAGGFAVFDMPSSAGGASTWSVQ